MSALGHSVHTLLDSLCHDMFSDGMRGGCSFRTTFRQKQVFQSRRNCKRFALL